jgi:hypothetical protein
MVEGLERKFTDEHRSIFLEVLRCSSNNFPQIHPNTSLDLEETPLMRIKEVESNSFDFIRGIDINSHDRRFIGDEESISSDVH